MRRRPLCLALLAGCAAPLAAQPGPDAPPPSSAPRVRTTHGVVAGLVLDGGVRTFRGIPFAAPPVGERRWRPPQPARPWAGVRAADRFAHQCMQARLYDDMRFRNAGTSEDCLYLNVWAPAAPRGASSASSASPADGRGRPVLVYFHGGGFAAGDGSEPRYDGAALARQGVVVVTLGYRLGVFGFLAHPALSAEAARLDGAPAAGNYGLMDQTAALRWVRANARAFGGDPARVTIAGESAGSFSVSAQMAAPAARGLFAGAIGESGAFFSQTLALAPRADAERLGVRLAELAGVTGDAPADGPAALARLRARSATELLELAGRPGAPRIGPAIDGAFLVEPPAATYAAGRQARVPLLAGWNSEEAPARAVLAEAPTPAAVAALLGRTFGADSAAAAHVFPHATAVEARQSATDLAGDRFIGYGTWKWLEAHARTSGQPVWRYLFARPRPPMVGAPAGDAPAPTGAVHSAEIEYVLGNLPLNPVFAWTPDDHRLSATLQGYVLRFLRTGDPNGPGLLPWPAGAPRADGTARRLRLDVEVRAEPEPRARYQFLDRVWGAGR